MKASPELATVLAGASRLVARVVSGGSMASEPLAIASEGALRGATMAIAYGTLRRYGRGDAILAALAHRGVPDTKVRALLLCALYSIESASYAGHVAVDQAVRACVRLGRPAAKPFVNGLLRAFLRQRAAIDTALADIPVARWMHPDWWIETLHLAYPNDWEAVLEAGNRHPPMGLRVNRRRGSVPDYLARLASASMRARHLGDCALVLETPVSVDRLPGFSSGDVSVQDVGAQRAARYLDLAHGQHVLDACAAPGGKASHILETADVDLLALDSQPARCDRIRQNFHRLGLAGGLVRAADCARPDEWWDGRPFDRVLADVPCTASGIVGRHPDIKWLRRPGDPARFAAEQLRLLDALWQVLAPGGKLLYVTCSVFPEENAAVLGAFCASRPARRLELPDLAPAQLLPSADNDGFYYALLQK